VDNKGIKREHILIVDDNSEVREVLQEMITSLGYACFAAVDGVDALEKMTHDVFDIVITDVRMPRMDGIELIKQIVIDYPGVDIVAITGYSSQYKYTDLIDLGAADFISKPFDVEILEARINRIIRERALKSELKRLSAVDGLTELLNRRHFDENLKHEANRAVRQHYDLYLLLIDIDNLKIQNDRFGHPQGDGLIRQLGAVVAQGIRAEVDSAYRIGGDEFAVLLPHTSLEQARLVAERLRSKYHAATNQLSSISVGIAKLEDTQDDLESALKSLIERADRALYWCKGHRGNQVCHEVEGLIPEEHPATRAELRPA
jgi:two-component system cell cycle response regulator